MNESNDARPRRPMLKMSLSERRDGRPMGDPFDDLRQLAAGLGYPAADIPRMVRSVERIADGVGGISQLALRPVPPTPRAAALARMGLTSQDLADMLDMEARAAYHYMSFVCVPIRWLRALTKAIEDPRDGQ